MRKKKLNNKRAKKKKTHSFHIMKPASLFVAAGLISAALSNSVADEIAQEIENALYRPKVQSVKVLENNGEWEIWGFDKLLFFFFIETIETSK